eukprot:5203346-Amphidinium_carterae.2
MCPNPDPARYNRCSRTSSDTEAALNEPTAEMVPKRCPPHVVHALVRNPVYKQCAHLPFKDSNLTHPRLKRTKNKP